MFPSCKPDTPATRGPWALPLMLVAACCGPAAAAKPDDPAEPGLEVILHVTVRSRAPEFQAQYIQGLSKSLREGFALLTREPVVVRERSQPEPPGATKARYQLVVTDSVSFTTGAVQRSVTKGDVTRGVGGASLGRGQMVTWKTMAKAAGSARCVLSERTDKGLRPLTTVVVPHANYQEASHSVITRPNVSPRLTKNIRAEAVKKLTADPRSFDVYDFIRRAVELRVLRVAKDTEFCQSPARWRHSPDRPRIFPTVRKMPNRRRGSVWGSPLCLVAHVRVRNTLPWPVASIKAEFAWSQPASPRLVQLLHDPLNVPRGKAVLDLSIELATGPLDAREERTIRVPVATKIDSFGSGGARPTLTGFSFTGSDSVGLKQIGKMRKDLAGLDVGARREAAKDLSEISLRSNADTLIQLLTHDDCSVREKAIESLSWAGDEKHTAALAGMLGDTQEEVQRAATRTLLLLGSIARKPLLAQLAHEKPELRAGAAKVLGESMDPAAVRPLVSLLKDTDATVRRETVRALGILGGQQALRALKGHQETDAGVTEELQKALKANR